MEKKKVTKKPTSDKLQQLIKRNKAEKAKFKHIKLTFMENRFGPLVFVLLFAGIGTYFIFNSSAAPQPPANKPPSSLITPNAQTASGITADLTILPATQPAAALGSTITADVWVNSSSESINAIQADLSYPVDKLQFVSIDGTSSAFSVQAQADGADGKVSIARGTIKPVTGKQEVAKVIFKVIAASGDATVSINDSSSVLRSSDNGNILNKRDSATYNLTN